MPPAPHISPAEGQPRRYDEVVLPPTVSLETGRGGLPVVRIDGPAARAEIYLHGAHLTAWTPRGHEPVLWMSSASRFSAEAAIRGGVPICFPWFGPRAGHPESASHGFARLSDWSLVAAQDDGQNVTVGLRLTDSDATGAKAWPCRFEAIYTVVVGARLCLTLTVTNLDEHEVTYEEALHTYLGVGDIRATEITGLEGTAFYDKLAGPERVPGEPAPLQFRAPTDRIYLDTSATTTVRDHTVDRSVLIAKAGSRTTVVWNPWVEGARGLTDLTDDEWTTMVCVEVSNVRDAAVRLGPGESHTMTATFELQPVPAAEPTSLADKSRTERPDTGADRSDRSTP